MAYGGGRKCVIHAPFVPGRVLYTRRLYQEECYTRAVCTRKRVIHAPFVPGFGVEGSGGGRGDLRGLLGRGAAARRGGGGGARRGVGDVVQVRLDVPTPVVDQG